MTEKAMNALLDLVVDEDAAVRGEEEDELFLMHMAGTGVATTILLFHVVYM